MVLNMKLYAFFPQKQECNQTKYATHRVFFPFLIFLEAKNIVEARRVHII